MFCKEFFKKIALNIHTENEGRRGHHRKQHGKKQRHKQKQGHKQKQKQKHSKLNKNSKHKLMPPMYAILSYLSLLDIHNLKKKIILFLTLFSRIQSTERGSKSEHVSV